jgi:S1-C subfamily serine protease
MKKRWLLILGSTFAVLLVLAVGAAAGGAIAYSLMRPEPAQAAYIMSVESDMDDGILVAYVEVGSPAAEAGLVRGDILLAVNDEPVEDMADYYLVLADLEPGDTVELTVLHGDEERTLSATLGERDRGTYLGFQPCGGSAFGSVFLGSPPGYSGPHWYGEGFFLPGFEKHIVVVGPEGALVAEVIPDTPAAEAGLMVDDVILSVDGEALEFGADLAEVIQSYSPGDTVVLEVERTEDEEPVEMEIEVTLGENPEVEGKGYLGIKYTSHRVPGMMSLDVVPPHDEHFYDHDWDWDPGVPFEPGPFAHGFHELPEEIEQAIIIGEVLPDTPAELAGLKIGDIISALDGEVVEGPDAFAEAIRSYQPGDQVTLTVYPKGADQPEEIQVTLGENPDEAGKGYLGVRITGFIKITTEKHEMPDEPLHFEFEGEHIFPGGDA